MSRSVVCQTCKSLVGIEAGRWTAHLKSGVPCPMSNTIYRAPVIHRGTGAARPGIELVSAREVSQAHCPNCGNEHPVMELLFRKTGQDPQAN